MANRFAHQTDVAKTTPPTVDPISHAARHLVDLQHRLTGGDGTVTPAELAEARAAAEHETLAERGRLSRRERAAAAAAAVAQENAISAARSALERAPVETVTAAFDAAEVALVALIIAVGDHNTALSHAAEALRAGGVQDGAAHSSSGPGVKLDGRNYPTHNPASWMLPLVGKVAGAHNLSASGGRRIGDMLGDKGSLMYAPNALRQHVRSPHAE